MRLQGTVSPALRRTSHPGDLQKRPGTKRKREAPQARAPSEPPLSQEERDYEPQSLAHQRPDGLWINWHTRTFAILEFTRAYDSKTAALRTASETKAQRYQQLLSKLQAHLPAWTGLFIPFTMGIRGTFCEKEWESSLKQLGVPVSGHNQLLQTVVSTTLSSLDKMFRARNGYYQQVANPGTDPPAGPGQRADGPAPAPPHPTSSNAGGASATTRVSA